MQVTTSCRHDHNSLILFSSVVVTEGHEQLIPFVSCNARGVPERRQNSAKLWSKRMSMKRLSRHTPSASARSAGRRFHSDGSQAERIEKRHCHPVRDQTSSPDPRSKQRLLQFSACPVSCSARTSFNSPSPAEYNQFCHPVQRYAAT